MIDGTPERLRIEARIVRVNQLSSAYSLRYIAQHTPNGIANNAVRIVNMTVPIIGVKIPPLVIPSLGTFVTKSQVNCPAPLETISQMTTTKKKHTKTVLINNVPHSMTVDSLDDLNSMVFPKTVNKIFAQHIRGQCH